MRAQQTGFDFDTFQAFGWTATPIDDYSAAARERAARMEREHRERQRERKERHDREQREREQEHARRARSRSSAYESPWDILGVRAGASKSEVRAAWVRLCRQHHPDAGGDIDTMKRVNRAYQEMKGMAR